MKSIIVGMALLMSSSFALACDKDDVMDKNKNFEEVKKESLKRVEEHSAALQKAKECMDAAKDKPAIADCHKKLMEAKKKCDKKCKHQCDHHGKGKKHHEGEKDHDEKSEE